MKKRLDPMYLPTPDSDACLRNENICIEVGGVERATVPASQVDSIVFLGKNTMSTALMAFCGQHDITLTFLGTNGEFCGRVCGPVSGNVLLRKRQYDSLNDVQFTATVVRNILFGKIRNSKDVLLRYARTASAPELSDALRDAARKLSGMAGQLTDTTDVNVMRGIEGAAANAYFSVFDCILNGKNGFVFETRSKRPPLNEVNAVLSFVYTLATHDCRSALETVGLDPAAGYLHTLRPGRSSFALDLIEELRAPLCDRFVISLLHKGQLSRKDFVTENGAVMLNEKGRRTVIGAWRERKREEIMHPFLKEKIPVGLIPYTQAMLFARVLRGDLDLHPPFVWR